MGLKYGILLLNELDSWLNQYFFMLVNDDELIENIVNFRIPIFCKDLLSGKVGYVTIFSEVIDS